MTKLNDKYTKFYLDNGIKCILYKRSEVHSVSIQVRVRVGSFDESEKNSGISHFIEHLAFDGTKNLPTWQSINDYQNSLSGNCNAYTDDEHTAYHGSFPSKYIKEALYYYAELVFNPLHKLEDIEKERAIIQDERKNGEDDVNFDVYMNLLKSRYSEKNTLFSRRVIGSEETIDSFNREALRAFYEEKYIPENMEIYISGSFDISKTKKTLNEYFNNSELKKRFSNKYKLNPNISNELKIFNRDFVNKIPEYSKYLITNPTRADVKQYYLDITFPSIPRYKSSLRDRYIVDFVTAITASSRYQNSILYKRLREEGGMVYMVGAYVYSYYTRAFLDLSTQFDPKYFETIIKTTYDSIEELKNGKYGESIFNQRKSVIEDTHLINYDYPSYVLNWIIDQEYEIEFNNTSITYSEYLEIIKSIKFSEVVDMINKIYDWNLANINVLSAKEINNLDSLVNRFIQN